MSGATVEIPLDVDFDNRPQTLLNSSTNLNGILSVVGACSINTITDEGYVTARPPLVLFSTIVGTANGLFSATPGVTYAIETSTVTAYSYSASAVLGTVNPTGPYYFASSPLPNNVMFRNATNGYYLSAGVIANIVDANYTSLGGLVPGVVCLDGTYYVMDANSAIWGSNLNDASTWPALNRINAWQDRSIPVALIQHRSYVVALKSSSMQVFYDAGNAVGSPLLPLLQAQQPVGCVEATTIQDSHGDTLWVASMKDEGLCVVQMSNLQIQVVSPPSINRWIEAQYKLVGGIYAVSSPVMQATTFAAFGHTFYMLQLYSGGPAAVFDITAKKWRFWHFPQVNNVVLKYACYSTGVGFNSPVDTYFQSTQGYFRFNSLPGVNTPVKWKDTSPLSVAGAYPVQITTPVIDGGTMAEKTAMRLELFSDTNGDGSLQIAWSDDDYKTWSPFVTVPLTEPRVFLDDLGVFRRRAFRFRHIGPTPFRIQRAVLNVLVGST